jgi:hypothetical protein
MVSRSPAIRSSPAFAHTDSHDVAPRGVVVANPADAAPAVDAGVEEDVDNRSRAPRIAPTTKRTRRKELSFIGIRLLYPTGLWIRDRTLGYFQCA